MSENNTINNINDIETKQKLDEVPIEPCRAICETCAKEVTTFAKTDYNTFIFLLFIFSLYVYGPLYSILVLFLTMPLFKNVVHTCPYCDEFLLEKKFYPIKVKEGICSLQYWNCIIIMKVIYIYIILATILSFGIYINYVYYTDLAQGHYHGHDIDEKVNELYMNENLSWEELIKDCGGRVIVENSARANEIFNRKYYKQVVEWKGYFLSAFVQQPGPGVNIDHLYNINVRMIPSESLRDADLFLSLNPRKYQEYQNLLKSLSTGDAIKFRASFEAIGNEWKTHHLHLISVEKTEDFIDPDKKIVLFQGIEFNITGHMKNDEEMKDLDINNNKL